MLGLSTGKHRRRRLPSGVGLLIAVAASFALWLLIAVAAAALFLIWI
jgi:hypothetical protein